MQTKLKKLLPKDLTRNSDSISIDHSTLFLNCQCIELLNVSEPTIFLLRDIEKELLANNSTLMVYLELLDLNNGRIMPWKFNPMVDQQTSDSHLVSTLDGGNCSEKMEHLSSMKKEK
jgi:hypothetical protein